MEIANTDIFFQSLQDQKWAFYVPERIVRAHQDGLLSGWGWRGCVDGFGREFEKLEMLIQLLDAQKVHFQMPFAIPEEVQDPVDDDDRYHSLRERMNDAKRQREQRQTMIDFANRFAHRLIAYNENEKAPPLPDGIIKSDTVWDELVTELNLGSSQTERRIAFDDRVCHVRFFRVWVALTTPAKIYAPRKESVKATTARRVLRNEYGLNGTYFGHSYSRHPVLVVLKKVYPPEQVRRVRRQMEDRIRKNPAEVVRFAIELGLLK